MDNKKNNEPNKTPTSTNPFQTSKIRPKTPPRLSLFPQIPAPPKPLSESPSLSPILSRRPPPPIPSSSPVSLFVKTRSVFESRSPQGSPAIIPSPITALSAIRHKSPPPPPPPRRSIGSRPSSRYMSEPAYHDSPPTPQRYNAKYPEDELDEEVFMPRSLDGNNKPPSPVFLHGRSGSDTSSMREVGEPTPIAQKRRTSPILGALSRFVGGHQYEGLGSNENYHAREPLLYDDDED